jgi:hypothetical protein
MSSDVESLLLIVSFALRISKRSHSHPGKVLERCSFPFIPQLAYNAAL